jgi:hypothetical protein
MILERYITLKIFEDGTLSPKKQKKEERKKSPFSLPNSFDHPG